MLEDSEGTQEPPRSSFRIGKYAWKIPGALAPLPPTYPPTNHLNSSCTLGSSFSTASLGALPKASVDLPAPNSRYQGWLQIYLKHWIYRRPTVTKGVRGMPSWICMWPRASIHGKASQDMGVSENSGTPKSSILIGFSIINHPFWGTPIFGNTHMFTHSCHLKLSQKNPASRSTLLWHSAWPWCLAKSCFFFRGSVVKVEGFHEWQWTSMKHE